MNVAALWHIFHQCWSICNGFFMSKAHRRLWVSVLLLEYRKGNWIIALESATDSHVRLKLYIFTLMLWVHNLYLLKWEFAAFCGGAGERACPSSNQRYWHTRFFAFWGLKLALARIDFWNQYPLTSSKFVGFHIVVYSSGEKKHLFCKTFIVLFKLHPVLTIGAANYFK